MAVINRAEGSREMTDWNSSLMTDSVRWKAREKFRTVAVIAYLAVNLNARSH